MKKIIKTHILCGIVAMVSLLMGCNSAPTKPVLTVSIQPQKYLLERIVGDKFDVQCLLAKGANPESYEPNMTHLINLEKSHIYFSIGNLGFELAIKNKLQVNAPQLKVVNCSQGIQLLQGTHSGVLHTAGNCSHGHNHEVDPHVWTSVVNAKIIAENMYKTMLEYDPKHKDFYTDNFNALTLELDALQNELAQTLAPKAGTAFAVWHPSLSYFARDYNLTQIAMECEGKEVSAGMLKKEIDVAKESNVKVLFFQKEFDNRQIQVINEELGARLVEINPMAYEWADEMRSIAYAISTE